MNRLILCLLMAAAATGQIVDPVKHLPGPPRQPTQSSGEAITPQPVKVAPSTEAPKPVAPTTPAEPQAVKPNQLTFIPVTHAGPPPPVSLATNAGPWSATTAPANHWQPAKPTANPWETKPTASPWK